MMDDLPDLYSVEKQRDRLWTVIYEPDDEPLCYVAARHGEPDVDARHRALTIANVMNATVDVSSLEIRELFEAYETAHGRRHHADWREGDEKDSKSAHEVYHDDVLALLEALLSPTAESSSDDAS